MKYDFIKNRETLEHIIRHSGMSTRPEFYSGRGAITCDLNSAILKRIHHGIHHNFGDSAANSFVEMVQEMEDMSATNFLQTLYSLQSADWKWNTSIERKERIAFDEIGSAWATVGEVLSGHHQRDQSHSIKSDFLWGLGIRDVKRVSKKDIYGDRNYRYFT